jgi:excinuclease ABC subunit C
MGGVLPQVRLLPPAPGVYRFRDGAGRVLYLGRATDLRSRVASYWRDLGDRPHLARMVARVERLEAVVCDSVHEAAWLERNLLEESMPRWNRTPGGQEVPVYLMLDAGPARPGLRVAHRPAGGAAFGPYLGGLRARRAASALHRIHPLPYAKSSPTGAERDMAARLGIGPADRDPLAGAVAAVLRREPGAVRATRDLLIERRDAAAAELSFERAAKIQGEIEALDWVTCAQRVTTMDGRTTTVHGWADGVLVRFGIRDGRLCVWTQRRAARPPVHRTISGWETFAQRNAALAALFLAESNLKRG